MIYSFKPIADENSKVLILGSMPSVKSLEQQMYYGNKQNQFWKILYRLFGAELEEDYEKRVQFLLEHGIAVWDVAMSCEREGSSDSKIKNPEPNDFQTFLAEHSGIDRIYFNGAKSEEMFKKLVEPDLELDRKIEYRRLLSTSPANTVSFEVKFEEWSAILK